jgi:hypothetical protein
MFQALAKSLKSVWWCDIGCMMMWHRMYDDVTQDVWWCDIGCMMMWHRMYDDVTQDVWWCDIGCMMMWHSWQSRSSLPQHQNVSMCLCVYVSMCLCVYVSMCLCVYMSFKSARLCTASECVYVSMCLCVYVSIWLCTASECVPCHRTCLLWYNVFSTYDRMCSLHTYLGLNRGLHPR